MKTNFKLLFLLALICGTSFQTFAQCENWASKENKGELENKHIFYRDAVKAKDYAKAYPLWKEIFAIAPGADGKRATHYSDGREILKNLYAAETDEGKKAEMLKTFMELYEKEYACYPKDKKGKDKKSYLVENRAYEMFYTFNTAYEETYPVLQEAYTMNDLNTGYSVIYPYADITVDFFTKEKLTADEALAVHKKINEICNHQISTNKTYGPYYKQVQDQANERFNTIGDYIFGCDYFLKKLQPQYSANPDDPANYRDIYAQLKAKGCDSSVPLMAEIYGKMQKDHQADVAAKKAQLAADKAAWQANNPASMAKKAYDSGDFNGAAAKYEEAIAKETDPTKKASLHFYAAAVYGRKLKQSSKAKSHLLEAIKLRPGWGKPHNLLGDLYAKSARSFKESFDQRMAILAAVSRWRKAAKDPEVASEANKKIGQYANQKPSCEDVFMKPGVNKGGSYRVGGWIQESVIVECK